MFPCDDTRLPEYQAHEEGLAVDEQARRVAWNEILFREANEQVEPDGRRLAEEFEILCECGEANCMESVPVTRESYERTRRQPTDFLIKPGHDKPEFETVIERHDQFVVVRKRGEAALLATRTNPRP